MPLPLFIFFSLLSVAGAVALIVFRNPVSSAMAMVVSFVGMAALFIGMNAYFVGIIQILVYTGAIMVLFLFIIMLLDIKSEERSEPRQLPVIAAFVIPTILVVQLVGILQDTPETQLKDLQPQEAAASYPEGTVIHEKLADGRLPDVNIIGQELFTKYNFPLQVVAVLLLVATVGCVVLSKRDARHPKA